MEEEKEEKDSDKDEATTVRQGGGAEFSINLNARTKMCERPSSRVIKSQLNVCEGRVKMSVKS